MLYNLNLDKYYEGLSDHINSAEIRPEVKPYTPDDLFSLLDAPMNQLVNRYDIKNKNVLSLASYYGHQEYFFGKNNCNLTFVDIDDGNDIEPYLKKLQSTQNEKLHFYIGDADNYYNEYKSKMKESFDILFISSFTLDEIRRRDILKKNNSRWTKDDVYMDTVENYTDFIKDGGLFISLSYAYSIEYFKNPHAIKLVQKQLKKKGIVLIELYQLVSAPHVSMTIGYKGSVKQAKKYVKTLKDEINTIHGRLQIPDKRAVKTWTIEDKFPNLNFFYGAKIKKRIKKINPFSKIGKKIKTKIGKKIYKSLMTYNSGLFEPTSKVFEQGSTIDEKAYLYQPYTAIDLKVGKGTYIAMNSFISMTEIGKFCSIGPNFLCGFGIHPTNTLSTSPAFYSTMKQNGMTFSSTNKIEERKPIKIGNDVFIGMNVSILDGVTIGDGAVVAAGAVVNKDVEPYSIVGGVPAKHIKYRFSKEQIEALLKIQWWDWSDEKLQEVEKNFFEVDKFIKENSN